MSKPDLPSNAWSFTTLKTQCKNQNESILELGIPLQKDFKADVVSSVNKYKVSLEPVKHINDSRKVIASD